MTDTRIELESAPCDPGVATDEYQDALCEFFRPLDAAGMPYSPHMLSLHAVAAGDYPYGAFSLVAGTMLNFAPFLTAALVAWIKGRAGRKVRVTVGDTVIEASTIAEIEELIPHAVRLDHARTKEDS